MLNSKLHKICQPLISELKFWNFPLFYRIIYTIYVNKRYLCPKHEFESNNNVQNENEPNEIDPEPEKVHSIAESLLSLSNLRAHLMSLGEDTDAFDSLKKLERIYIKKSIEESQSKQTNITKFFPVNQLTLK